MTAHQSIATVTAILSQVVQGFAARAIEGAKVTLQRPDSTLEDVADPNPNKVNLFLFQVNFDPSFRNEDLPTRDSVGRAVRRPRAALQLHYLLSFYGDESVLAPQRMLAAVVAGLHARPWISMERAADFTANNHEAFDYLADSTLSAQGESVRLTPDSLNLEELSKLWSVFFQVPYALSIAYKASAVLIDVEEPVRSVLPVRTPVIDVRADHAPISVESVQPEDEPPTAPIFADTTLVVTGSGFAAGRLVVRIDDVATPIEPSSPTTLSVALAGRALSAGSHVLQVARVGGARSNPYNFALRPHVQGAEPSAAGGAAAIAVHSDVTIRKEQRVEVLLDGVGSERATFTLPAEPRSGDTTRALARRSGVPRGTYLVRLRIDGAESTLDTDASLDDGTYTGPLLELPA